MPKILVVDDIPAILDFSREFFEDAGFDVRTAETATAAIAAQREFKADLILQDLNIPEGGGIFVYETLRAGQDMVPMIFSTGKPEAIGNLAGMTNVSVLKKPTDPDVLMSEVRKHMTKSGEGQMNPPPPPPPPGNR
ncbi:MAG: hypothetical protein COT18_06110 [Elusimicrobia bacterium CG08_land_8_20_14_0_20_59_10]|nr:MAG: hypothetical protein COT18_06110 [Elusimicrobia bacterium CG08_land_8_20_14_0_20_59_10]